jgi:hypothetical protein
MQKLLVMLLCAGFFTACSTKPDPNKNFVAYFDQLKNGDLIDSFQIAGHSVFVHYMREKNPFIPFGVNPDDAPEQEHISKDSTRVQRHKDTLLLKLDNGTQYALVNHKNTTDTTQYNDYYYSEYRDDIKRYVISDSHYQQYAYLLVNPANGDTTQVATKPLLSPDHSLLFVSNYPSSSKCIEMYSYNAATSAITRLGAHAQNRWLTGPIEWIANDTLRGFYIAIEKEVVYPAPVKITIQ